MKKIIEQRINEEDFYGLETFSEHKHNQLVRLSEDEVAEIIFNLENSASIKQVVFESQRMGAVITTNNTQWNLGCNALREVIKGTKEFIGESLVIRVLPQMSNAVFNFIAICNHCELSLDEYEAGIESLTEVEREEFYKLALQAQRNSVVA